MRTDAEGEEGKDRVVVGGGGLEDVVKPFGKGLGGGGDDDEDAVVVGYNK